MSKKGGGGGSSSDAKGLATVYKILQEFKKREDCGPFLLPVIQEYPTLKDDYLLQISKPMDFSTVEKNYKSKAYKTPLLMCSDINLVFKNCIDFNEQSHPPLVELARRCMRDFKSRLEAAGLSSFGNKDVTKEQKKKFSQMIYNISSVDLGQIVSILENACPKCLQNTNPNNEDEFELDIDLIDPETFWKVESIAKEKQQDSIAFSRATKSGTAGKKRKAGK